MSAPNTDPEKQKEHHRAPLLGMRGVIIWALVLLVLLIVFLTVRGNDPGEDSAVEGEATTVEEAQGQD
jgi:hypothetical protein